MPSRQMLPWYNKNIQAAKRHRRYCERLWIRTSLCVHFEMFKVNNILVKSTFASTKSEYYNKKLKASKENQMTVFSVQNKVYYIKVKLSFQIISTQIKIWPIVLITSSVKTY